MNKKQLDCPCNNPAGYYSGKEDKHMPYVTPCEHWSDGICNWFNPPYPVSKLIERIEKGKVG